MDEIWKDIKGYEGLYQVSNLGNVKSIKRKKLLTKCKTQCGYIIVCLFKENKRNNKFVHRLVADAFIPNPNNLPQVNHKDENKMNNSVDNLEWCSVSYNNTYATRIERMSKTKINGKKSKPVLQFDFQNNFIKEWPSVREIERTLGYKNPGISSCCRGKQKTAYNYMWKYKQED